VFGEFVHPEEREVYSIDECFLDLTHHRIDPTAHGRVIRERVMRWTGLPVCVGFGQTKTLSKLGNNIAKKQPQWQGVCDLTALSDGALNRVLTDVDVGDVWGIGRRLSEQLKQGGIATAAQLRNADAKRIRERFRVVVERTVSELQGTSCLSWETEPAPRKQIVASRSFGAPIYVFDDLVEPMHACGTSSRKLRQEGSIAGRVGVWIETNRFRPQDPQYSPARSIQLPMPTDDTAVITAWAVNVLQSVFRQGFRYVKVGVMLGYGGTLDLESHTRGCWCR
jgi:DNA polymerase V